MKLSQRLSRLSQSVTLQMNEKANSLAKSGQTIYNLTAGQLPFTPPAGFIQQLQKEAHNFSSYQYCPGKGDAGLREKLKVKLQQQRQVEFPHTIECVLTHGAKQAICNLLGAIVNPGDEVVLLAPYWVSYPEMVKVWDGKVTVVSSSLESQFEPDLKTLEQTLSTQTKCLILNSPNNPSGVFYSEKWMRGFATLLRKFPDLLVISDEIYSSLGYETEQPTYFYQYDPILLQQTAIVDGISKNLASTGLRLGYFFAPTELASAAAKLQGQMTSGANSLIQNALRVYQAEDEPAFIHQVKTLLRTNKTILKQHLFEAGLSACYYSLNSAFYFLLDFSSLVKEKTAQDFEFCERLLAAEGVALVPGSAFGMPNTARLSLVLEKESFEVAIKKLITFLQKTFAGNVELP